MKRETTTLTSSSPAPKGCLTGCAIAGALGVAIPIAFVLISTGRDPNSPLARMYRTEADLSALKKALSVYQDAFGTYPPGGVEGLRMATDYLSRKARYLPGGPPPDGWGQTYFYVPAFGYEVPGSVALRGDAGFLEPDGYQLYSAGADGDPGGTNPEARMDNIVSWDAGKTWRRVYDALQVEWNSTH